MAYTPGFEHDIFISFSHEDNLAPEGEKGWVSRFREELEIWLRRRGVKGLEIWWDEEQLRGNTDFDARIERVLSSTALLLVLHSRNYRQSDYCRKELDWFVTSTKQHPLGLTLSGDHRRILNVLINNIPHQEWEAADHWTRPLSGTSGIKLHDADKVDDFGDPIAPELFTDALKPLITATQETLQAFPKEQIEKVEPAEDHRPRVYVADVADTLRPFRKRLIKEIGEHAHLLDAIPPPLPRNAHDQAISQMLEEADLSIHLLDQWPGREIEDDDSTTYPRHQADLATVSHSPALIWVPDTLADADFEDEGHKTWLKQLEQASRAAEAYQFIRQGREPFIAQVLETLVQIADRHTGADDGSQRVLIDTHRKDQHYAFDLAAGLTCQNRDLEVDLTMDTDGFEGWKQFEQGVRRSRDLIVLFGKVTQGWVNGRVERAYQVAFGSEGTSLENIWVLLLPDCPGMPKLKPLIRVEVLDNRDSDDITADNLRRLLPSNAHGGGT